MAQAAYASCGSTYCTVNTNWDVQGLAQESGLALDVRYAYTKARDWMAGSSRKTPPAPSMSDSEIEDRRTINQLLDVAIAYSFNPQWAATLSLPLVVRDHSHTFDSSVTGPFIQQAGFSKLGDVRVGGRYAFRGNTGESGSGLRFGLKLPTGATNRAMTPPDPADPSTPYKLERSSQPGTGSTDVILGGYHYWNMPDRSYGWFLSGQVQSAMATRDRYRPGREWAIDLGGHYELAEGVNVLLQVNGLHRDRDSGANANPASGGRSWNISPGISFALTPQSQIYGFVQLPLHQYKNTDPADAASGQLAARWSASIGFTQRF